MIKIILLLFVCLFVNVIPLYAEYNIEFKLNNYKSSLNDYDIIYYKDYKQIVKDIYRNNKLINRIGQFPNGKINFINYNNIIVATVNMLDNRFDGECVFWEYKYSEFFANSQSKIVSTYKKGVLNGRTTIFKDDKILYELNYKNGTLDGESIFFDSINNLKKIVVFNNGIKVLEKE